MGLPVDLAFGDSGPAGARALLLLHGSPTDRRMWEPQVDELSAEGYRVVAADLRGHGQSPLPPDPWTLEDCAADVLALADRLRLKRFVLGGLSTGGAIALAVAERAPGRLEGLLLASARADAAQPEERERLARLADELSQRGSEDPEPFVGRVFTPETVARRPELVERFKALVRETPVEGRARLLRSMAARADRTGLLPKIACPTLVVAGAEDPITPPAHAQAIHAAVPGSFLQVVVGASHLVNMEAPGVFNRAVANWLMFAELDP